MPSDLRNRATASAAASAVAKLPRCFWRPSCFSCAWNWLLLTLPLRHTPLKPVMFSARRSVRPSCSAAACASAGVIRAASASAIQDRVGGIARHAVSRHSTCGIEALELPER